MPILKLASGKFIYSDKVDLIESIVYPLFNIAVKRFNADTVTCLLVSTSIGSIMRFWYISNLYRPRSHYRVHQINSRCRQTSPTLPIDDTPIMICLNF
jgi:hypothetical protein